MRRMVTRFCSWRVKRIHGGEGYEYRCERKVVRIYGGEGYEYMFVRLRQREGVREGGREGGR